MQKSRIEWTDYTLNPIKGLCPVDCRDTQGKSYCYARAMYKRFKWDPTIRFDDSCLYGLPKEPKRIFVGSTMELFGPWVKDSWLEHIFQTCNLYPQHTFIFLTKQPQNFIKWSPFPDNCWVGVSVCDDKMLDVAVDKLEDINAKNKFISFEPLLKRLTLSLDYAFYYSGINWLIIGQQTPVTRFSPSPKIEWVEEIVNVADKAGVPVFLKDNLRSLLPAEAPFVTNPLRDNGFYLRQEFPLIKQRGIK